MNPCHFPSRALAKLLILPGAVGEFFHAQRASFQEERSVIDNR
jgi:hypothetical protein